MLRIDVMIWSSKDYDKTSQCQTSENETSQKKMFFIFWWWVLLRIDIKNWSSMTEWLRDYKKQGESKQVIYKKI